MGSKDFEKEKFEKFDEDFECGCPDEPKHYSFNMDGKDVKNWIKAHDSHLEARIREGIIKKIEKFVSFEELNVNGDALINEKEFKKFIKKL